VSDGELAVLEERLLNFREWVAKLEARIAAVEFRLGAILTLLIANMFGIIVALIMLWVKGT
jgi:hypothetical protein